MRLKTGEAFINIILNNNTIKAIVNYSHTYGARHKVQSIWWGRSRRSDECTVRFRWR